MSDPFWREHAACRDADPDMFFEAAHRDAAQALCARCPVTAECLASRGGCEGMWGGQVFKPEGYSPECLGEREDTLASRRDHENRFIRVIPPKERAILKQGAERDAKHPMVE